MTTHSRYTPGQEAEIAELFSKGATYAELKTKFGGSGKGLRSVLRRQGVHEDRRGSRPRTYTGEQGREIAALFQDGASILSLVKRFGGCKQSVISELKRREVYEYRPGGHGETRGMTRRSFTSEETSTMVEMWDGDCSKSRIARTFATTQHIVERELRSRGIEPYSRENHASGEAHGRWNGGRVVRPDGYAEVRVSGRYVKEHRHVMEQMLGRKLHRGETVHHIDGDKGNNDPSNLQLRKGQHGTGIMMVCQDCGGHNVVPAELI